MDVGVSWYPLTAQVSGVQRSRGRSNGDFAQSRAHQRERRSSPSTCELQAEPCRNLGRCRKVAGKKVFMSLASCRFRPTHVTVHHHNSLVSTLKCAPVQEMENPAQQRHFQFRLYSPRSGYVPVLRSGHLGTPGSPERDLTASTVRARTKNPGKKAHGSGSRLGWRGAHGSPSEALESDLLTKPYELSSSYGALVVPVPRFVLISSCK
jgi:hypothetical protein